jgi:hypothetical protein
MPVLVIALVMWLRECEWKESVDGERVLPIQSCLRYR